MAEICVCSAAFRHIPVQNWLHPQLWCSGNNSEKPSIFFGIDTSAPRIDSAPRLVPKHIRIVLRPVILSNVQAQIVLGVGSGLSLPYSGSGWHNATQMCNMLKLSELPDDVLARLFQHLCGTTTSGVLRHASLAQARHGFALAQCCKRLLDMFRVSVLVAIDARPFCEEPVSAFFPGGCYRDPFHLARIVRIAGPMLRRFDVPDYEPSEEFSQWPVIGALAQFCPNLCSLSVHDIGRRRIALRALFCRVVRLRVVTPTRWALRAVSKQATKVELVGVSPARCADVIALIARVPTLRMFHVSFSSCPTWEFLRELAEAIAASDVTELEYAVERTLTSAPVRIPVRKTPGLQVLRVEVGEATRATAAALEGLTDEATAMTLVDCDGTVTWQGGQRVVESVIGSSEEEVLAGGRSEGLRTMRISEAEDGEGAGKRADLKTVARAVHGRALQRVTMPASAMMCWDGTCGGDWAGMLRQVHEVVISCPRRDADIWGIVDAAGVLVRGLRQAGAQTSVVLFEGCLQTLDGVCQRGMAHERKKCGLLRTLLRELVAFGDCGVEFCGLREGVARLLEEHDGGDCRMSVT